MCWRREAVVEGRHTRGSPPTLLSHTHTHMHMHTYDVCHLFISTNEKSSETTLVESAWDAASHCRVYGDTFTGVNCATRRCTSLFLSLTTLGPVHEARWLRPLLQFAARSARARTVYFSRDAVLTSPTRWSTRKVCRQPLASDSTLAKPIHPAVATAPKQRTDNICSF